MDNPVPEDGVKRRAEWEEAFTEWCRTLKSPRLREQFYIEEIAQELSRRPRRLEMDHLERRRIVGNLFQWIQRGEFSDSEVMMLTRKPELFGPFMPEYRSVREEAARDGIEFLVDLDRGVKYPALEYKYKPIEINVGAIFLQRAAAQRYLKQCGLESAQRVLIEWFPDLISSTDADGTPLRPMSNGQAKARAKPGPRPERREKIAAKEPLKNSSVLGGCLG